MAISAIHRHCRRRLLRNRHLEPLALAQHSQPAQFPRQARPLGRIDPTYDLSGKRVALIGGGSSGIQILPRIQPLAKRVDHYMKGRNWIPPVGFGAEGMAEQGGSGITRRFSSGVNPCF